MTSSGTAHSYPILHTAVIGHGYDQRLAMGVHIKVYRAGEPERDAEPREARLSDELNQKGEWENQSDH